MDSQFQWWLSTDREHFLHALRSLIPNGGTAVVIGDDNSGRYQAARLVDQFLGSFGYSCHDISIGLAPKSIKSVLLHMWKALAEEPSPGEIPPWVSRANSITVRELVGEVTSLLNIGSAVRRAIIVEELDRDGPLDEATIGWLEELTSACSAPLVVTSCEESNTDWGSSEILDIVQLEYFSTRDVREALVNASVLSERSIDDLDAMVASIASDYDDDSIPPSVVYTHLAAITSEEG